MRLCAYVCMGIWAFGFLGACAHESVGVKAYEPIHHRLLGSISARALEATSGASRHLLFHGGVIRSGLMILTSTKSLSLSVTTTQSLARAVAAMMASRALRERPVALLSAMRLAQTRTAFSSKGRTRPEKRAGGPSGPANHAWKQGGWSFPCPGTHEKPPPLLRVWNCAPPEERSPPISNFAAPHQRSSPGVLLGQPLRSRRRSPSSSSREAK